MSGLEPIKHYPAALPTVTLGGEFTPRLKKRSEQTAFVKYDIDEQYIGQQSMSVQERMRIMDRFFLHNPHPEEECNRLNLPSNRLHLHSLKDVMYLAGGLVGIRFEGEELRNAAELLKRLTAMWSELDKTYKNMNGIERKMVLANENPSSQEIVNVQHFHTQCDEYLIVIKNLQSIIRRKQVTIEDVGNRELPKLDADPDSRVGSQYPTWYIVLKQKYATHHSTFKDSTDVPKFTLGKFAVFLSSCVHGPITCTPEEIEALGELKEASVDNVAIFMPDVHVSSNVMTEPQRRYWAHRFFNFLKSVPELKSIVKDDKAVETMSIW